MNRLCTILTLLALLAATASAEVVFRDATHLLPDHNGTVGVVAWGDVNDDGCPDLFVGGQGAEEGALFLNRNGSFEDATARYNIPPYATRRIRSAQFLDYNGDGRLDLFLLTSDTHGLWLLEQTSHGTLMPVPVLGGTQVESPIRAAVWTDVDSDGALDLILSNVETAQTPMTVLIQEVNEFIALRDNPWEEDMTHVSAISVMDYDRDGDLDVMFGYDNRDIPRFYRNDAITYTEISAGIGFRSGEGFSGAAWFDYNNDQRLDLFLPGTSKLAQLYDGAWQEDQNTLSWIEREPQFYETVNGTRDAHPVDVDMDGWPDLFLVNRNNLGCGLLMNNKGDGSFEDVIRTSGLPYAGHANPPREVRAAAWADFDKDGDLDVAMAQGASGVRFYRNDTRRANEYLSLKLCAQNSDVPLGNCRVLMIFEHGKRIATSSPVTTASGGDMNVITLASTSRMKSDAAELIVDWPNGITQSYLLDELTMSETNLLRQPIPQALAEAPELDVSLPAVSNYEISPNPFNPATTVTFTLGEAAHVDLRVYNLMGQEVARIAEGTYEAGTHRLAFNGATLPTGIYFSRLSAGPTLELKRMLLAK